KLLPGHVLLYQDGEVRRRRYWNLTPNPDDARTEADWLDELRERLRDAVESHLVADVPVGAFLSGGLDSGALVAVMARGSARHVKVALSGLGGDEVFGGYERYVGLRAGEAYRHIPAPVRRLIAWTIEHMPDTATASATRDRLKRFVAVGALERRERYRALIS